MNTNKIRLVVLFASLLVNTFCTFIAITTYQCNFFRVIGSYLSIALVTCFTAKLPALFFVFSHTFVLLASSFGTLLQFYNKVYMYDKFVHYLSGILLAYGGYYAVEYVFAKKKVFESRFSKLILAFLFSSASAAFWEIYEFLVDVVFNMNTQGNNSNTMGDIIAGVLGATTYLLVFVCKDYLDKKYVKK